ncbi:MAG TPA: FtsX-like permease family protein [Candidatus Acidoferrales bacterium]|jgi:putative ABC transport system permease protein|nr:FtsX-like permease family protein [Candidatus Acidoferrales bacterium]
MPEKQYKGFVIWDLLWSNLGVHPLRSALSVFALALQVFLVLLIVGLTSGALSDWRTRAEGVGADIIVQPPNSSIFFAFSSAVMPETLGAQMSALPGVRVVAPVLIAVDQKNLGVLYGIDYQQFAGLSDGFTFLSGGPFQAPDQTIVDDLAAGSRKLRVGQKVTLLGHEFTISGIVVHGKGARYFIPIKTAQDIVGAEGRVSMFFVRSTGNTDGTRSEIVKLLPTFKIRSMAEFSTLMTSSNLPELKPFIRAFVILGVVISFLVVLLTMHTLVFERTRDIGILRALGSSRMEVCGLILGETLVMVALGSIFGLICTYSIVAILHKTSPTLQIAIEGGWILRAILLTIGGAIAGAAYPALRAAQSDPVDALAYE